MNKKNFLKEFYFSFKNKQAYRFLKNNDIFSIVSCFFI